MKATDLTYPGIRFVVCPDSLQPIRKGIAAGLSRSDVERHLALSQSIVGAHGETGSIRYIWPALPWRLFPPAPSRFHKALLHQDKVELRAIRSCTLHAGSWLAVGLAGEIGDVLFLDCLSRPPIHVPRALSLVFPNAQTLFWLATLSKGSGY